jgi:hypothetical protein
MRIAFSILVLLAVPVAACGSSGDEAWSGELKGVARIGHEAWRFQPCGSPEQWNISIDAFEKRQIENVEAASKLLFEQPTCTGPTPSSCPYPLTTTYLELVGDVSAPGMYGHLNAHNREVAFRRIIVARREIPADCLQPSR